MSKCKGCNACGFDTILCFIEELGIYLCNQCREQDGWKQKIENARMLTEEESSENTDERRLN